MSYREHPAPDRLRPWVACLWERRGEGEPVRVLPDGCIDVLWTQGAGTQIVGPNTIAFLTPVASGTHVVGARMRPGAAPALLGVDPCELRDGRIELHELWGEHGRALGEALDRSADPRATISGALDRRALHATAPDPLVAAAIARLDHPGALVVSLAEGLAVSERHLRRRFAAAVGYGPKRLARVLRLRRALAAARADGELARVALDAGYADQAHFANDCRALAGVAPTALV
jgi:AraC-like DNA-binding protein